MPCCAWWYSFLFAVILALVQKGSSLKCYTCSSPFGGACDKFSDENPPPMEECSSPSPWCFHVIQNVDATKGYPMYVQRGCSNEKHCNATAQTGAVQRFCFACNLNLCNNAELYHKNVESNDDNFSFKVGPDFLIISLAVFMFII